MRTRITCTASACNAKLREPECVYSCLPFQVRSLKDIAVQPVQICIQSFIISLRVGFYMPLAVCIQKQVVCLLLTHVSPNSLILLLGGILSSSQRNLELILRSMQISRRLLHQHTAKDTVY